MNNVRFSVGFIVVVTAVATFAAPAPCHAAVSATTTSPVVTTSLHSRGGVQSRRRLESITPGATIYGSAEGGFGAAVARRSVFGKIEVDNTTIILVPDRTARRDPLKGLQTYSGGWNPGELHYWSSVGFSASFAPIIGLAWLLLGLGLLLGACCTCCFCEERWSRLRSDNERPYSKSDLTLPLILMIFGVVTLLVGMSVMVAGGVMFRSNMNDITDYAITQVDRVVGIVNNASTAISALTGTRIASSALPPRITGNVTLIATEVNQTAVKIQTAIDNGSLLINGSTLLVYRFMFGVGMTITLLCLLGFAFAMFRVVIGANIILFLLWGLVFWTWIASGVFFTAYLVEGDSVSALDQVMHNPAINSVMNKYLPCASQSEMQEMVTLTHSAAFISQTFVKGALEEAYSKELQAAGASSVCVPYAPPTYDLDPSKCPQGSLTLTQLFQAWNQSNASGISADVVNDVSMVLVNTDRLDGTLDSLKTIFDCSYVRDVAQYIIDQAYKLESNLKLLWIGFIIISVACMLVCGAMPTYVFRSVRLAEHGVAPEKSAGLYVAEPMPAEGGYPVAAEGGYPVPAEGGYPVPAEGGYPATQ